MICKRVTLIKMVMIQEAVSSFLYLHITTRWQCWHLLCGFIYIYAILCVIASQNGMDCDDLMVSNLKGSWDQQVQVNIVTEIYTSNHLFMVLTLFICLFIHSSINSL